MPRWKEKLMTQERRGQIRRPVMLKMDPDPYMPLNECLGMK